MNVLIGTSLYADSCYEEKLLTQVLASEVKKLGYKCDYFFLPMVRDVLYVNESIVFATFNDVTAADILITIGYPACFLSHNRKSSFLFSTFPALYELMNSSYGIKNTKFYEDVRAKVEASEMVLFKECKKLFCGSSLLKNDIMARYGINSEVFYLPNLYDYELSDNIYNGKYFVAESDLYPESRVDMILDAFKLSSQDAKLVLFVARSGKSYLEYIKKHINMSSLADRVKIVETIAPSAVIQNASGYLLVDYNTRRISNGLMRAVESSCPIIVTADSGAPLELDSLFTNLIVVEPSASAISVTINEIAVKRTPVGGIKALPISELAKSMVLI